MTARNTCSTRGRLVVGSIVLAISATGLTSVATSALFVDAKAVTAGPFATGTVSLTAVPVTTVLSMAGMAPGAMVTKAITVTNNGTLAQRYAVVSVTTENALAAQLDLTIKSGVTTCTDVGFAGSGVLAYAAGDLGSTAPGTKLIGDSATGQTGVVGALGSDRLLAAGGAETLCAQVVLPLGTANALQNITTIATLTFNAEQTINN